MNDVNEGAKTKDAKSSVLRFVLGILIGAAVVIGLIFAWSVVWVAPHMILLGRESKLKSEFGQVQIAVLSYYTEYSVYPVAPDSATLIKMLSGESAEGNQRRIVFFNFRPTDFNAKGELVDPWGTPIELSVTADGKMHARSAGPDKTFGTPDDISGDANLAEGK